MNIRVIFDKAQSLDKQTLLTQGFQRTVYNSVNVSLDGLFKDLVSLFIETNSTLFISKNNKLKTNTQTGVVKYVDITAKPEKKNNEKIITFGSDLKIILGNLVGILGYEMGTNITIISLYPTILKQNIDSIKEMKTYFDIKDKLQIIKNMYNIGCGKIMNYTPDNTQTINLDYNYRESNIDRVFNELNERVNLRISNNNEINIDIDREYIYDILMDVYEHTTYNDYNIDSVDELCIELGKYKPCYDNYFMKIWELLFKESYADYYEYENVYPKFTVNKESQYNYIECPFINLINTYAIKLDKTSLVQQLYKSIDLLEQYFQGIYQNAISVVNNTLCNNDPIINVKISNCFPQLLAEIFLNMMFELAKNIVIYHEFLNSSSKSVKLQFMEIFQCLRTTTPTLITLTESQMLALHYILMTKQNLETMYVEDTPKPPRKRRQKQ